MKGVAGTIGFIALALAAVATAQQKGAVKGSVTDLSGIPLARAALHLERIQTAQEISGKGVSITSVESDDQGKFAFDGLEAGRYLLSAERNGYVGSSYGMVTVAAGEERSGVSIKLAAQGIIAGKITNQDGEPFPNARVTVYRWSYIHGMVKLRRAGGTPVGADGEYSIGGLREGRYTVAAVDTSAKLITGASAGNAPAEAYPMTYYPGVVDQISAAPVDLSPGQEARAIDIRLRKVALQRVRGRAIGLTKDGPFALTMRPLSIDMGGLDSRPVPIATDGTFEFDRVPPGSYRIESDPPISSAHASELVTVGNRDEDAVSVLFGPMPAISGTIAREGGKGTRAAIELSDTTSDQTLRFASKPDGSFSRSNIPRARYLVDVTQLPPGTYVKSIRFGNQDVGQSPIDLTSGTGGTLDVALSSGAADVSGTVSPEEQVTIWNSDGFEASAAADVNGKFKVGNLKPGDYRIAAWEKIEPGMESMAAFRTNFDGRARAVTLMENSHATATDVPTIKRDEILAAAAAIR